MDKYKAFFDMVNKWTVNDYRTQKIKAEVIIDMMISEHIEEIVSQSFGKDIKLIAKEFPIARIGQPCIKSEGEISSNRQYASVDFLMSCKESDKPTIYLVELKTSDDSVDGTQLWNMLWTCKQGSNSLYNRFYDIIMNYGINENGNALSTKKYQYTLSKYAIEHMPTLSENVTIFGSERLGNRFDNVKANQERVAKCILQQGFYQHFHEAEMQILYVSLNPMLKSDIIKLAASTKKEINKKISKRDMVDTDKKAVMDFLESDVSTFVADKHIQLTNLQFGDAMGVWTLISDILSRLQVDWQKWFDEKEMKDEKKYD